MKLWLFDILACPIDKHYPLELYIFALETREQDLISFINIFRERNLGEIQSSETIQIFKKEKKVYLKDNIVLQKTEIKEYLKNIFESIRELDNVHDKSNMDSLKTSLEIIRNQIKPTLSSLLEEENYENIKSLLPELYFFNKVKLNIEIESGLLLCEKCKRWYPIIETIPQMLPDEYRDKEKDKQFLKNNKNLLVDKLLELHLQPFDI